MCFNIISTSRLVSQPKSINFVFDKNLELDRNSSHEKKSSLDKYKTKHVKC